MNSKRRLILCSILLSVLLLIGCSNPTMEERTFSGVGEYWQAEFTIQYDDDKTDEEQEITYVIDIQYKEETPPEVQNWSYATDWLHKEARIITDEAGNESFQFDGDDSEPINIQTGIGSSGSGSLKTLTEMTGQGRINVILNHMSKDMSLTIEWGADTEILQLKDTQATQNGCPVSS